MKKLLVIFGLLIVGLVLFHVTKVEAGHTYWGSWIDTSLCMANNCGTSEGTKSQIRTCQAGGNSHICNVGGIEYDEGVCLAGYANRGLGWNWDLRCYKFNHPVLAPIGCHVGFTQVGKSCQWTIPPDTQTRVVDCNDALVILCPTPTPTPTEEPSPMPTVEPSPTPEPTVEPTSVPEPENPCAAGKTFVGPYCGWSPSIEQEGYKLAVCTDLADPPQSVLLQHFVRISPTQVELGWWPSRNADKYSLLFGYYGEGMNMGLAELSKDLTGIVINDLRPNVPIMAQIWSWKGECHSESQIIDP